MIPKTSPTGTTVLVKTVLHLPPVMHTRTICEPWMDEEDGCWYVRVLGKNFPVRLEFCETTEIPVCAAPGCVCLHCPVCRGEGSGYTIVG